MIERMESRNGIHTLEAAEALGWGAGNTGWFRWIEGK